MSDVRVLVRGNIYISLLETEGVQLLTLLHIDFRKCGDTKAIKMTVAANPQFESFLLYPLVDSAYHEF
jgi:hypothetical protein